MGLDHLESGIRISRTAKKFEYKGNQFEIELRNAIQYEKMTATNSAIFDVLNLDVGTRKCVNVVANQ